MKDIEFLGIEFDNVEGFKVLDTEDNTVTYTEGGGGSSPGSYGTATWTKGYQQGRLYVVPTFENFEEGYFESAPNISTSLILEGKSVTPSETAQTVSPTSTDYYLSTVNVGAIPSEYVVPTGTKPITANGTGIDVANYASVDVAVPSSVNLVKYVLRPDAVLANSYTYDKYMNADESITIPGYSTSAQTIKASASLGSITLDRDNYYYYIVERMLTIPTYSVTSVAKGRCEYHIGAHVYEIIDIPASSMHSLINPSLFYTSRLNTVTTTLASYRELYYSSGTALSTYSTQAYGVCQAAVAPSISSGTVTINSPTVTCRGHTTYFTSTYANAMTDVRAQYVIEVYKAPKNSSYGYDAWGNDQLMKQIIDCVNSNTQKLT